MSHVYRALGAALAGVGVVLVLRGGEAVWD
jgi:hypothetical protein